MLYFLRFILKPLSVITLIISELSIAGFHNISHNGTHSVNPAMRSLQIASILCNLGTGGHRSLPHNGTAVNSAIKAPLMNSALCRKLSQQSRAQVRTGDSSHQQSRERSARQEVMRKDHYRHIKQDALTSSRTVSPTKNTRGQFKEESHFIKEGSKYRRVTKHQARKQRWAAPEALQAVLASAVSSPLPATATEGAGLDKPAALAARKARRNGKSISKRFASPVPFIKDCTECEVIEKGICTTPEKQQRPFRVFRNNGVVAIPLFNGIGSAGDPAESETQTFLIEKFNNVGGTYQPDTRFPGDGMDELSVRLPSGERITEFTLAKDNLIVLSRSDDSVDGLSRVTTISLNGTANAGSIDGLAAPDLSVRGELYRFHDDTLYTFSEEENKVFIYPHSDSENTQSATPAKGIDLTGVRSPEDELVSILADESLTYVATRRSIPDSGESEIKISALDRSGELLPEQTEFVMTPADQQYELYLQEGKPVLMIAPTVDEQLEKLICSGPNVEFGSSDDDDTTFDPTFLIAVAAVPLVGGPIAAAVFYCLLYQKALRKGMPAKTYWKGICALKYCEHCTSADTMLSAFGCFFCPLCLCPAGPYKAASRWIDSYFPGEDEPIVDHQPTHP